jgi:Zn-dependent protease with chaperone function
MVTVFVCEILFGLAASIIVAWFSRQREFRADAGSAKLLGSPVPMQHALARLAAWSRARCRVDGGVGHFRRRRRLGRAVLDPPADGRAHRGAAGAAPGRIRTMSQFFQIHPTIRSSA